MPEQRMDFSQLEPGYEFPSTSFSLDRPAVDEYLGAVESDGDFYRDGSVPMTMVAARALAALTGSISLPPGSIHTSQELEFHHTTRVQDALTSRARVSRKQSRGRFRLLSVDFDVADPAGNLVLSGKTSFILPEEGGTAT